MIPRRLILVFAVTPALVFATGCGGDGDGGGSGSSATGVWSGTSEVDYRGDADFRTYFLRKSKGVIDEITWRVSCDEGGATGQSTGRTSNVRIDDEGRFQVRSQALVLKGEFTEEEKASGTWQLGSCDGDWDASLSTPGANELPSAPFD